MTIQKSKNHSRNFGSEVASHEDSQHLERNFGFLSLCGVAVTTGESWIVLGNSLVFAIHNGGPPGVIYGFIVDSIFYWFVAASIAEIASAIPSSGTVFHWASITAGKHGRICGWFAGWWNFFAWIAGVASLLSFMALQLIAIYTISHPSVSIQSWDIFCCYLGCTWICCLLVLFANRLIPMLESLGAFLILAGFLISIIVCVTMSPMNGTGYASHTAVWSKWENTTGWSSQGLVFCLGMLNAAFAVCAPDIPCHMAEEIPQPKLNIPKAILAQYVSSFVTGFCYLIAILYAASDLRAITSDNSIFPLSQIYRQATGSTAATIGLLIVAFIPTFIGTIGGFTIVGRTYWALARSRATPYHTKFARIDEKTKNPFNAILLSGVLVTLLGCIYIGSERAFDAIAGSFVVLTSLSYLMAILPHLLSGRSHLPPGPFRMGHVVGNVVNGISCAYLIAFCILFCFPLSLPVDAQNMNYSALIVGGLTLFMAVYWLCHRSEYEGPALLTVAE